MAKIITQKKLNSLIDGVEASELNLGVLLRVNGYDMILEDIGIQLPECCTSLVLDGVIMRNCIITSDDETSTLNINTSGAIIEASLIYKDARHILNINGSNNFRIIESSPPIEGSFAVPLVAALVTAGKVSAKNPFPDLEDLVQKNLHLGNVSGFMQRFNRYKEDSLIKKEESLSATLPDNMKDRSLIISSPDFDTMFLKYCGDGKYSVYHDDAVAHNLTLQDISTWLKPLNADMYVVDSNKLLTETGLLSATGECTPLEHSYPVADLFMAIEIKDIDKITELSKELDLSAKLPLSFDIIYVNLSTHYKITANIDNMLDYAAFRKDANLINAILKSWDGFKNAEEVAYFVEYALCRGVAKDVLVCLQGLKSITDNPESLKIVNDLGNMLFHCTYSICGGEDSVYKTSGEEAEAFYNDLKQYPQTHATFTNNELHLPYACGNISAYEGELLV